MTGAVVAGPEAGSSESPSFPLATLALAGTLGLALAGTAAARLSLTIDEWRYVQDGVKSWFGGGSGWLIDAGTLPLTFWIQNAPDAIYLKLKYGGLPFGLDGDFGKQLPLRDQMILLHLARGTNVLIAGLGTILATWLVAYRSFGASAAAAAFFCAIEPNLLAGYSLATADAIIVPVFLITMHSYQLHLARPHPRSFLSICILFGLGIALKVSMFPFGLLRMAATFATRLAGRLAVESSSRRRLRLAVRESARFGVFHAGPVVVLGLLISWAANGFLMGWLIDPSTPNLNTRKVAAALGYQGTHAARMIHRLSTLRVPAPIAVMRNQAAHSRGGHPMTFLGVPGSHGPWYYYPYIFSMKAHLMLAIAAVAALFASGVWSSPIPWSAGLLVGLSCAPGIKGGPRYFLVLFALQAALGGAGLAAILGRLRGRLALAGAAGLGAASLLLTLNSMPDFLAHTSPLWGGDREGYRYADANYDWGQGLYSAFAASDHLGSGPIRFIHFGDPHYGVPPGHESLAGGDPRELLERMRGGYAAVSVHCLFHSGAEKPRALPLFRALSRTAPDGRLGNGYFLYDLRDRGRFDELANLLAQEVRSPKGSAKAGNDLPGGHGR